MNTVAEPQFSHFPSGFFGSSLMPSFCSAHEIQIFPGISVRWSEQHSAKKASPVHAQESGLLRCPNTNSRALPKCGVQKHPLRRLDNRRMSRDRPRPQSRRRGIEKATSHLSHGSPRSCRHSSGGFWRGISDFPSVPSSAWDHTPAKLHFDSHACSPPVCDHVDQSGRAPRVARTTGLF